MLAPARSTPPAVHHSPLWSSVQALQLRTVAVMGMTKNTGKTVSLNHLLAQAHQAHVAVGLTSIGRDGEERDQVFSIPKPPVMVTPGCLVATARDTLLRAKVRTRLLGGTGIESPMGEIVLVKALEGGEMEVAGASRSHDQHRVIALLRQCGAELVLLDGALGRSHHASPAIADGVVLATGAAIGGGVQDVVRKTRDRLAILGIAQADEALAAQVQAAFDCGGVGAWDTQGTPLWVEAIATLNAAPRLLQLIDTRVRTIAVSGAVARRLWQALTALLQAHPGLTLVVGDGTKLFIEAVELAQFERQGGHVCALRAIRMAGITLNPFSPFGGSFDAHDFLAQARTALPGYSVCDVMLPTP